MYKVRKIQFIEHPILKNMEFKFVGRDGKTVDTVIFADENGCGKSVIIDELYQIVTGQLPVSNCTEYEIDGEIYIVRLIRQSDTSYSCDYFDRDENETHAHMPAFSAIFSDVDINFHSEGISTVKH